MLKIVQTAAILTSLIFASSINISADETFTKPAPVVEEVQVIEESEPVEIKAEVGFVSDINIVTLPVEEEPVVEESTKREVTDEEYQLLLRVCMSETGGKYGEPIEGKVAVVETILNRVDMGYGTITEVVTAPYQYSMADNGEPDEAVVEAVEIALSGNMYPDDMLYFRTNHYHDFGTPYQQIGAHYFSCM